MVSLYANGPGPQFFANEGKQTTNLASIDKSKLSKFPVPVAAAAEQRALHAMLAEQLGALDRVGEIARSASSRLAALDQALLAKAFRGELVPQEPTDEPASVLLERIRAERAAAGDGKVKRGRKAAGGAVAARTGRVTRR